MNIVGMLRELESHGSTNTLIDYKNEQYSLYTTALGWDTAGCGDQ